MKRLILSLILLACVPLFIFAQQKTVLLWKDTDGMRRFKSKVYIYPAPDSINTGVTIIVCPGGSYSHLMGIATEGFGVAEYLNTQGINALVLRYRVGMYGHHHPAMIQDIQRAIQFARDHASEYHFNPDKIGAMGFSAGGHLVTMAGAFHCNDYLQPIGIQTRVSLRPDFVVPVYPVVSMQDSIAHKRSRRNLLTRHFSQDDKDIFSMEMNIPSDMPPVLLVTAKDDPVVMYQNSVYLDKALTEKQIKHHFLLYETGKHGYGMNEEKAPEAGQWKYQLIPWLKEIKILP